MIGESGHNRTDMVSLYAYEAVQHMGTNILGLAAREGWGGCLWIMVAATSWCLSCLSMVFERGYINILIDCSASLHGVNGMR